MVPTLQNLRVVCHVSRIQGVQAEREWHLDPGLCGSRTRLFPTPFCYLGAVWQSGLKLQNGMSAP